MTASNTTSTAAAGVAAINTTALTVLSYAFLAIVTFGIGSGVRLDDLRAVFRHQKRAFSIGLASQYLIVPAVARGVATALQMPDMDAFGVVLLGCCPGGAVSNAFAYFARGDLALSVSMTAVSNALAFGTMPLLLLIWTRGLHSVEYRIPYAEICYSLLLVLLPAAAGVELRRRSPGKWGPRGERLGAVGGAVLIAASIVAGFAQESTRTSLADPNLFPWRNGVAVALVAPIGMLFASLAVCAMRRCVRVPLASVATIVLETGVQNTVIALAICNLSTAGPEFSPVESFRLQLLTIIWGLFVAFEALIVTILFRRLIRPTDSPASADDAGILVRLVLCCRRRSQSRRADVRAPGAGAELGAGDEGASAEGGWRKVEGRGEVL